MNNDVSHLNHQLGCKHFSVSIYIFKFVWSLTCDFVHYILIWFLFLSFLVAAKSLFPNVATRDIRIVKGSKYLVTRWSSWWKSYLISNNKKYLFDSTSQADNHTQMYRLSDSKINLEFPSGQPLVSSAVVKTLSLRHYCVMCPLGGHFKVVKHK